ETPPAGRGGPGGGRPPRNAPNPRRGSRQGPERRRGARHRQGQGGGAERLRPAATATHPDDPPPFTPDRRHRPMGLPGGHEPAQQDAAAAASFLLRPVPRPSTRLGGLNLTPWKDKRHGSGEPRSDAGALH